MKRAPDVSAVLQAAQSEPAPVYLLVGEPYQVEGVARQLVEALVPEAQRSTNLERYDGRTTAFAPILDSVRTPGLFPGTKVIWVRDSPLFLSGEKRTEVTAQLLAAWEANRRRDAAEKLLTLAALAGWSHEQLESTDFATLAKTRMTALTGQALSPAERTTLAAVRDHAVERGLRVADFRDESAVLDEFLADGAPPQTVLLFTAATIDRRKRVVKTIEASGVLLELALERERSGALTADSASAVIDRVLAEHGQRLAPGARRLLARRAGSDPGALAMEVEKLCLYAGAADSIGEPEVRAATRDLGESWIFDFTRALAQRKAAVALPMLRGLFAQGEPPLRLLAMISREVRLLLTARDCLDFGLARAWRPGMSFAAFKDRVVPRLDDAQREAFGNVHPYALYVCMQNAAELPTARLQDALLHLDRLDTKLKSSAGSPRLLLEAFVMDLCRG